LRIRKVLAEDRVTNYELTLRTPSARKVLVSFNASIFRDTEGRVKGIFAVARDVTEQRSLETQIREQQNYSRGLIEASVDALMTVALRPHHRRQRTDGAAHRLQPQAAGGEPLRRLLTDPERATAGVRQNFEKGVVTNYELVARSKSGSETVVSFNASVFKDTAGKVAGILAAAHEITQQKQTEQELREQQAYNRGLIESNIDALMTTDPLGVITDVNRQMCLLTGRDREELIGTPFKNYFTDPQRAEDGIRRVLAEDRVTNYELTMRSKDGKETVASYNATTFKGADGRLRGVFAAARDITDQKQLEEQITERNRELTETTSFINNVLESSTEYSIIATDLGGNILTWNEGARQNYGYSAEEMVGKTNAKILYAPDDLRSGKVQAILDTAFRTGKAEGVFERLRKDGTRFAAYVAITLRKDANGKPMGTLLISTDITEQKALEEQLHCKNEELEEQYRRVQEANRLKSEFLANMSHELRTPLNAIIGFTELMHDGKVGPVSPPHKEYLGDVLVSARHLLQLINDVLDLSKVESGKMDFHPEPADLAKLIEEVWDILRTMAASKRMRVETDIDAAVSGVTIDPVKFKQVLYNFVSNALKFTPDEGRVTIRVLPHEDDQFRLEVEDSGIGIRPEDISRLFVEFQQLDAGAAKKYPGAWAASHRKGSYFQAKYRRLLPRRGRQRALIAGAQMHAAGHLLRVESGRDVPGDRLAVPG
jgi:PAS domain S-box-containing protein